MTCHTGHPRTRLKTRQEGPSIILSPHPAPGGGPASPHEGEGHRPTRGPPQNTEGAERLAQAAPAQAPETGARRAVRDQLLKALLEQVSIELPESVVANETRNVVYSIVNENQQRGVAKELIESKKDEIFATASVSAKDRVKAAFILNRIAEQEGIKAEQKEMTQRIVALAQQNKTTPEKFVKVLQERNAFPEIAQEIVTSKVLDFIELNAQVTDVSAAAPVAAPAA